MPHDSASGDGFAGFIEKIKKWGSPIIGVALFVFGLHKGVEEIQKNITWGVLAAVSVAWLCLYWVYTSKAEIEVRETIDSPPRIEKDPKFPRWWRKWALAGMILLPIVTISGFAIAKYRDRRPSNKFIVLVADFQGPDQKHAVTPAVINKLKRATEEFTEVEIKALRIVITEQEGSATAREKGREKKASIVIWGFYDEALTGTVHIETLTLKSRLPHGEQFDYSALVADKQGLTVKEHIAGDMSLISLLLLGIIHYNLGNDDEAIRRFTRALEQKSSLQAANYKSDLLVLRGRSFVFKKSLDSAIADYSEAIEIKPDNAFAYLCRGVAYGLKKEIDRAMDDFNKAIELDPNSADAYFNRGVAYDDKEDLDHAIANYSKAINLRSDYAEAYYNRGVDYRMKEEFDRAIADYSKDIELRPDHAVAYRSRGNAYSEKKDLDRAIADYSKFIQLKSNDASGYLERGNTYHLKEDLDRAIADYNKVIELRSDDASVYNIRGLTYYRRGLTYYKNDDLDRAIADFGKVIELRPDDAKAYYCRGGAYLEKKEFDRAIADYSKVIELRPDDVDAYNHRGSAYLEKQDLDRVIADFSKVIELRPDDAEAYNVRGINYYRKKEHKRAIADFNKAIKLKPDGAISYFMRGAAYEGSGNKNNSIADFRRSLELFTNPDDRKAAMEKLRSLGVKVE